MTVRRVRPKLHQLKPAAGIKLTVAELQTIARRRAVVDLPTEQRDFAEIWGREKQPKRKRHA